MATVGIIGDTHLPFVLDGYLDFCIETFDMFGCDKYVHIGDFCDMHAISFHLSDPDGYSAGHELHRVKRMAHAWFRAFPNANWLWGNHDELPYRQARAAGVPREMIRNWSEILEMPKDVAWNYVEEVVIDGVIYQHGLGCTGKYGHSNAADLNRMSSVQGHAHSSAGIEFKASFNSLIFGMGIGTGVDRDAYAMAYAKPMKKKPVISCGVIIDGKYPILCPMDLGSRYKLLKNSR